MGARNGSFDRLVPIGVVFGRFQPFHVGHLDLVLNAKRQSEFLVIGITNPDPSAVVQQESCPHRSHPSANPFTYYERARMVIESLLDAGVKAADFMVTPFPINVPEMIYCYVPPEATFFIVVEDDWGRFKLQTLRALNYKVEIIGDHDCRRAQISGTYIRQSIVLGNEWEELVTPATARIIKRMQLIDRIKLNPT